MNEAVQNETEEKPEGLLANANADQQEETPQEENVEMAHKAEEKEEVAEEDNIIQLPENLNKKFIDTKTGELDQQKLSDSYNELTKKMSMGGHKAPKEYNFDLLDDVEDDDPLKQFVTSWIETHRPTQEAVNELVGTFLELSEQQQQSETIDNDAELAKLGPNGPEIVKGTVTWVRGLVDKGVLGPDDVKEVEVLAATAEGIGVITKLRRYYEGQPIPTAPANVDGLPSKEEFYAMVGSDEYKKDKQYRMKVEKIAEQLFPGDATSTGDIR